MPNLSLFKISEAILAQAKDLILGGDRGDAPARPEDPPSASRPEAGLEWDLTAHDKTFWATMAGADRRLAELRRVIDQAAAEAAAQEAAAEEPQSSNSLIGESRWEAANRKLNDALKAEKP